jgi:N-acetylglucosamine kinase-like BadF-type ATPase
MKCAIRTADKMYKRHSDNNQLIERLQKAVKSRNYIAHQVVREYMHHREAKPRAVATISRELKKLEDDGQDLAEELLKELAALREAYDEDQRQMKCRISRMLP